MSIHISSLLDRFAEPETLKMAKLGRELRAKGVDVIDLSLGEPDFDTPIHIKEAAKKAVDDNYSHYTPVAGYPDLREAVCTKLKRDNDLEYAPENIVVSTGAKQSLANLILALVDKDDEVIIPAPFWVTYSELVRIAGGVPVIIPTKMENGFKLTAPELEATITPKSKVFLFSSPCNPSGSVYSKDELANLVEVFEKHPAISIISDEIYEYINFVGKHESIAQFASVKDRVMIVNGLSKGYAMTGYRLGYIAAPVVVAKACEKLQGQFTSGTNAVTQRAAIAALVGDQQPTQDMNKEFERRKKRVLELINEMPGWKLAEPDGAFYVFPDVSVYYGKSNGAEKIENADDLCMYLLNTAHVSTVTGRAFGTPNCIRLSFANSLEKIEEAYRRIKKALAALA
ncbi:MAG: pyridoxal phosphate-dependent aminotransferase [Bacteroidota bacterium]